MFDKTDLTDLAGLEVGAKLRGLFRLELAIGERDQVGAMLRLGTCGDNGHRDDLVNRVMVRQWNA